jgi:hypothetical protein
MIKLKITDLAYLKLKYFTKNVDTEISGLGKIRELEDCLEVYDIELFEQTVNYASSDLNPESLLKFLFDKASKKESVKDYKVWWHSHSRMESYFSPIDETTINRSTEFPYLISIVTNKRGDNRARLDFFQPLRLTLPLEVEITVKDSINIEKQCQTEISEKVKRRPLLKELMSSVSKDRKKSLIPPSSKPRSVLQV